MREEESSGTTRGMLLVVNYGLGIVSVFQPRDLVIVMVEVYSISVMKTNYFPV